MNRQDYLNKKRFHDQKAIPVQSFVHKKLEQAENPIKMKKSSWLDRIMSRIYGFGRAFKRAFTKTNTYKPDQKIKIALPKQAIQAERDHGYMWDGSL